MRNLIVALFVVVAGAAAGASVEDVIALSQHKVGEDILIAFVESSGSTFILSSSDILRLREAKVSDKVVVAMLGRPAPVQIIAQPEAQRVAVSEPAVVYEQPRIVEPVVYSYSYPYPYYGYPYYHSYPYYYHGGYPYHGGFGLGYTGHHFSVGVGFRH
jgi:hypothetical protein